MKMMFMQYRIPLASPVQRKKATFNAYTSELDLHGETSNQTIRLICR